MVRVVLRGVMRVVVRVRVVRHHVGVVVLMRVHAIVAVEVLMLAAILPDHSVRVHLVAKVRVMVRCSTDQWGCLFFSIDPVCGA